MTKEKLKPCPFVHDVTDYDDAGVTNSAYLTSNDLSGHFAECSVCGASGPSRDTPALASHGWNSRFTPSQQEPARAVSPKPLDDAALERLDAAVLGNHCEWYASPQIRPDLSHILTRYREMREALEWIGAVARSQQPLGDSALQMERIANKVESALPRPDGGGK